MGIEQEVIASYYPRGCLHNGEIDLRWDDEYKKRFIRAMIYPTYSVAKLEEKAIYSFKDLPKDG